MENLDDPFAIQITISLFLSLSLEENHLSISPGAYTEQTYRKTFSLSDLDLYFVDFPFYFASICREDDHDDVDIDR